MFKWKSKQPNLNWKGQSILFSTFMILIVGLFVVDKVIGFLLVAISFTIIGGLMVLSIKETNPLFGKHIFEVNNGATE